MNKFHALKCIEEQEKSTNIVTDILHVFTFSMCALLDPGSVSSFVIPLIVSRFDVPLDVLHESGLVRTPP